MQKSNKNTGTPTQSYLRLLEIRDNVVVMQDGTLRAVLAVSSTNFDLKNEEEQNSLIFGYQRFLNSLEFPVQILMQSRRIDIGDYVEKLTRLMERQTNELLKVQTGEYIEFINKLIENANIMNKNFYIIIPYSQSINPATPGFLSRILGGNKAQEITAKLDSLKRYSELLDQRVNALTSGISGLGLKAIRLKTAELIELYYNSYNFDSAPQLDASKLGDVRIVDSNGQAR